jgi:antitoxin component YwqK of YwqJK toxin-antitoxin module
MKPTPLSIILPVFVLLFCAPRGFTEDLLYRSNDFGMALARIPPYQKDANRWVLQVHRSGPVEVRRLFDDGKEARRWDFTWNREGTERVEKETAGGMLAARRMYDSAGSLLQEEDYVAGTLSKKTLFTYVNGRLSRTRTLNGGDGAQVSSEVYLYAANGGLREVRRTASPGESTVTSAVTSGAGLSEERSAMAGSLFIERYDTEGRMINREQRTDGVPVSIEDFSFDADSRTPASSEERLPADHGLASRRYDKDGKLTLETRSVNGAVRETTAYERDAKGKVTLKARKAPEGSESWRYTYSDSGDVAREEHSLRGIRVKVIVYGEDKHRTEELYKDGELFLKVSYDGDTRLREEVYANGTLQRERMYP